MKSSSPYTLLFILLATPMMLLGCETDTETEIQTADTTGAAVEASETRATAMLEPTEGNNVSGEVTFIQQQEDVRVQGTVSGLSEGQHGFHVHETGDCSAPDASSAGGHYAPNNNPHGAPTDPASEHHTGDMGNIMADASGTARIDTSFQFLSLNGQESIVGKAVIVHQGADDLTSQPSGDAGSRLACGVIEMQAPEGIENIQEDTLGTQPGEFDTTAAQ